jgi:hypothetical protein
VHAFPDRCDKAQIAALETNSFFKFFPTRHAVKRCCVNVRTAALVTRRPGKT